MSPTPLRVVIKPRHARPFFARHPWVFANSIASVEGSPGPGEEVMVVSHQGQPIARGLYNLSSAIRVRLYRWEDRPIDDDFLSAQLARAIDLRRSTLKIDGPGSACRLVFSEADGLSGLTVDQFGRYLVVQFTSLALFARREFLLDRLMASTGAEGVLLRGEKGIPSQEGLKISEGWARGSGPGGPVEIVDQGITYAVDLDSGQKTGFYLDQRENRRSVAKYCDGAEVLDLFCYTGGFSLNALKHGRARATLGVDSSASAIALARRNAAANGLAAAEFEESDVIPFIERVRGTGRTFDLVICDPPKFARQSKAIDEALQGYARLNRAALSVLRPGGTLVTCSCSGLVDRAQFNDVLGHVAAETGRPIRLIEQLGQAPDHPVSASCLETDYLKCVIARVD